MRMLLKIGVCLLIGTISTVAHAQYDPKHAGTLRIHVATGALNAFLEALDRYGRSSLFSAPEVSCTIGSACPVKVNVQELFDSKGKVVACAVQVGDIEINGGTNAAPGTETPIQWTIEPPAAPVAKAKYTFAPPGLIVFKDDDQAMPDYPDKLTATSLTISHRFWKQGGEVIYYPLVYQDSGSGSPVLCAAYDPKIVNH